MDIVEELSYRVQGISTDGFSGIIIKYMFSDELLSAVVRNISIPEDIDIKMQIERKKSERYSEASKERLERKFNIIKELQNSKGWFNPSVWDGIDQVPIAPTQDFTPGSAREVSEFMLEVSSNTNTGFLESGFYHPREDPSGALNDRKNIQDIRETVSMMEGRLDSGLILDVFTARKILNAFDKFVTIPYYENKVFMLLERDKARRKDNLSSKFINLLPKEEKSYLNEGKNSVSKKRRRMKRLLSEIIVSETTREVSKLQDDYINNKIGYQEYLDGMLEISDYAFEKWH
ncbi:MAG: hypothetical protein M1290_04535 [Candidatus Thermoplasmatota archaeon]|jgi:hypothetical protein|nr:hypothetical protein [Candidatus Thermoplasmatota archaeon]